MRYFQTFDFDSHTKLTVEADEACILAVHFKYISRTPNEVTQVATKQLREFILGKRKVFDLPLSPDGTDFQQSVWKQMIKIPFGKTKTYKDIALKTGGANYARAVGMACNKNPIPIFIPCHRVIGSSGKLIGYAGGLKLKKILISLEQN